MLKRYVGRTGLEVSRLGLGTMSWGTDIDEHEAAEQLTAFVAAGGTLVDTAAPYGGGASEEVLGTLLAGTISREDVVVATKAGSGRRDGEHFVDVSRRGLLRTLEESLQRLGIDHVDLWQVHVWSDDVPVDETLSALDAAVASGKTRYVGVSNYCGWQLALAAGHQVEAAGRERLATDQVEYSLVERGVEREVVPAAEALDVSLLPWSPLGRGVLTGKYRAGVPADSRAASSRFEKYVGVHLNPRAAGIVEAVCRAAEGLDLTPAQVALAWVRDRPSVAAPIVGARTLAQLQELLAAESVSLPDEIVAALDDVSAPATGYPES